MNKRVRSPEYLEWQRKYKAEKYMQRRKAGIIHLGSKCADCPKTENLHFDHIDRNSKSFPISRCPSEKSFWEELKKCQLLCDKCHREKSNIENSGENCYLSKLSHEQVKMIFNRLSQKIPQAKIAQEFGVKPMQISRIKNGTRWRYITDDT